MKKLAVGFVAGAAVATTASALAFSTGQSVQLKPGDSAYILGVTPVSEQTTCQVVTKHKTNLFSCFVGTDYRGKYSVSINGSEVTVSRYLGPGVAKPYRVIFHRNQTHVLIAH
jgi:hypothetical protein